MIKKIGGKTYEENIKFNSCDEYVCSGLWQ